MTHTMPGHIYPKQLAARKLFSPPLAHTLSAVGSGLVTHTSCLCEAVQIEANSESGRIAAAGGTYKPKQRSTTFRGG